MEIFNEILTKKQILIDEPMKKYTSFKIGGNATAILFPHTIKEISDCINICKIHNIPYYVIGNGSNILVSDKGVNGVIIKLSRPFDKINIKGNIIRVQVGATLINLSKKARDMSLMGAEFMISIPGTVGGGICMNAGAYGGEMKDIIKEVKVLKDGNVYTMTNEQCEFEYRNSKMLKEKIIVLEATIELEMGNKEEIIIKMKENIQKRNNSQPTGYPSAGSIFKRPLNNFAGKLIMDVGLKGKIVGGACISEKHCGFILNVGEAKCKDVIELMDIAYNEVQQKFGVKLEREVKILGEI